MKRMFKFTMRFLPRILFVIILTFVTLVVALLSFTVFTPKISISGRNLEWLATRYLAKIGLQLKYDNLEIDIEKVKSNSKLYFVKTVSIHGKNVCVDYGIHAVNSCAAELHLQATIGWPHGFKSWIPNVLDIAPPQFEGGTLSVDLREFASSKKPEPSGFNSLEYMRTEILPHLRIIGTSVELSRLEIRISEKTGYSGDLALHDANLFLTHVTSRDGLFIGQLGFSVLEPQEALQGKSWAMRMTSSVDLKAHRSIRVRGTGAIRNFDDFDFQVQAAIKGVTGLRQVQLKAEVKKGLFAGVVSVKAGRITSEIESFDFINCAIEMSLKDHQGHLKCGPQTVALKLHEVSSLKHPELFHLAPLIDFELNHVNLLGEKSADVVLKVNLNQENIFTMNSQVSGHVVIGECLQYDLNGNLNFSIPSFQKVVRLLSSTPFAVPAPVNNLDGSSGGDFNLHLSNQERTLNYHAVTQLDSAFQSLHLHFSGVTKLDQKMRPDTDAVLNVDRLRLSAPRFDLRLPPRFYPDPRFSIARSESRQAALNKPAHSDFRLKVLTSQREAAQLSTNLTKAAIPLSFNFVYTDHQKVAPRSIQTPSPVTGWIEVGRTPIEMFRRQAVVENLKFNIADNGEQFIDGKISMSYMDYDIQMFVTGTTKQPNIRFESDPALEDNEILAVLVFGRPLQELGDDEKSSVSNLDAALADTVLGLSSLYLLASTPIDSVGYDPQMQMLTANVGLGGGASLELGKGDATQGIGLRKRLSRDFVLRSDVEQIGTTGNRTVTALVEWMKRF